MLLRKLSLTGFKNIAHAALEFPAPVNCFTGGNGAGKTNVLDALHLLSVGRSAFGMTDSQCVRHGEDFYLAEGQYEVRGRNATVVCGFKKGGDKSLRYDGKQYDRLSDHIGRLPVVVVAPSDSFLVTDPAEERRRYLDSFLSLLDRTYLNAIMRYRQVLGERNKLLKGDSPWAGGLMEVLDMQLCETGAVVHRVRGELAARLAPLTGEYYGILSGDSEQVELEYRSDLDSAPLGELLTRSAERDLSNRFTTCGVHRDDLKMSIGGFPLRRYGSQGQQKSFLIALKLAQYRIIAEQTGVKPLLLLDDVFDRLDAGRVGQLISLVSGGSFGQIFITDHSKSRLKGILDDAAGTGYALFDVEDGAVKPSKA